MSQDKIFYLTGQKFSEIFILGQFFSRTKIPVTGPATVAMCILTGKEFLSTLSAFYIPYT